MSKTTADTDIRVRLCYQCWEPERGVMYFTTDRDGKRSGAAEMHESGTCIQEVGRTRQRLEKSAAEYEAIKDTLPKETRVVADCFIELHMSRGAGTGLASAVSAAGVADTPNSMAYMRVAQKVVERLRENGVLPK